VAAATFYFWFRGLREPHYDPRMVRTGISLGLGLLMKLSIGVLMPGLALVIVCRAFQVHPAAARVSRFLRMSLGAGGAMLAVAAWWFIRNLLVYGEFSGNQASIHFYQMNLPSLAGHPAYQAHLVSATWRSFWGVFGWLDIPLPEVLYQQILLATVGVVILLIGAGLCWLIRDFSKSRALPAFAWQGMLAMIVVAVTLGISFFQFNTIVAYQPQGRYFFQALLPAGLVFTSGLYFVAPGRLWKRVTLSLLLLWMAYLNLAGLAQVIAANTA
jgi:hypothetical protein